MLEPNNRQLLRDALRPPAGYVLDRAITTTFSLDLMALLAIPVSFTCFQLKDQDGPPQIDPLALVEALRRYAGKIAVFCQAGQIHVPRHVQLLLGYLEDSVHEVKAPRGGVFHPKLTVLRYTAQENNDSVAKLLPVVYRLLCSSRNLTFDRSWDTLLLLDGVLAQHRTNAFARNHSLARFVRELPGLCINPVSERWASDVNSTADELLKVEFEIPNGFTDMEFAPLGLGWTPQWPIIGHRRMLAMAPFVDDGFIKRFVDSATPLGIVSRAESLDELSGGHISKLFRRLVHEYRCRSDSSRLRRRVGDRRARCRGLRTGSRSSMRSTSFRFDWTSARCREPSSTNCNTSTCLRIGMRE